MRLTSLRFPRLSLLLVCLIVLRLSGGSGIFSLAPDSQNRSAGEVIVICTGMGGMATILAPDAPLEPIHRAMGAHCPFCLTGNDFQPALSGVDFSLPLPKPASVAFLPPYAAGFHASPPDLRHAPKRAPPAFA
ncbi:MAG: hypothetical protein LBF93_12260 [Zoogloeaceae bacterium]|jgi:hypothetical protein|nr:hypothetical protein [Zoogloeaceae bacterium]